VICTVRDNFQRQQNLYLSHFRNHDQLRVEDPEWYGQYGQCDNRVEVGQPSSRATGRKHIVQANFKEDSKVVGLCKGRLGNLIDSRVIREASLKLAPSPWAQYSPALIRRLPLLLMHLGAEHQVQSAYTRSRESEVGCILPGTT
jgi:hypothetical protein